MIMEFVQELILTVLIAALLSYVVAKLVSVAAAKDVSGETLGAGSPAMEEIKFEERLKAPDLERHVRSQYVEEVAVDQFVDEAEAEEGAVREEELGLESCDQILEAPERRTGEEFELKVNVGEDSKYGRSDETMKSTEESSSRGAAFEKNLDVSKETQTEPSGAQLESTELPQKSALDVESNETLADEEETRQSSAEEVKREDTEPEKPTHTAQSEANAEVHEESAIREHIDDDDWEGIEWSELQKDFAMAADYCGSESVSNDLQMQLYGLHKVATQGPCYEPQPMALKVTARAKCDGAHCFYCARNAWQRLGSMNPDVAMEQYITILSQNNPNWKDQKLSGPTEADTSTPVSDLNTKSIPQPNIAEDRTGASNASVVDNEADIKDENLMEKV